MTTDQVIAHWRKRARDSLRIARLANDAGSPADALFHCHLALERALKAEIMQKTGKPHPRMHDLLALAKFVTRRWSEKDQLLLDTLTGFAVAARYDDPAWAERYATSSQASHWIESTEQFLSRFLS